MIKTYYQNVRNNVISPKNARERDISLVDLGLTKGAKIYFGCGSIEDCGYKTYVLHSIINNINNHFTHIEDKIQINILKTITDAEYFYGPRLCNFVLLFIILKKLIMNKFNLDSPINSCTILQTSLSS